MLKQMIDGLFIFISYGIVGKLALRSRTQFVFSQFVYLLLLLSSFWAFVLLGISRSAGSMFLLLSLGVYWLIIRTVDSYVDANWPLFRRPFQHRNGNVWAIRVTVYLFLIMLLIGVGFSGYWWAKGLL